MRLIYIAAFIFIAVLCVPVTSLSPPWYKLAKIVASTIGSDVDVDVSELSTDAYMHVNVTINSVSAQNSLKLSALATILRPKLFFGRNEVSLNIIMDGNIITPDTNGSPHDIVSVFDLALTGNKYYIETKTRELAGGALIAFPIFKSDVISIWSDDRSEYYFYTSYVASDLFQDIFLESLFGVNIFCSTKPGSDFIQE